MELIKDLVQLMLWRNASLKVFVDFSGNFLLSETH